MGGEEGNLLDALRKEGEQGLIHESSLLVFRLWMQFGGPTSPPTPQEIADMDASLALDIAWLLRLYKRMYSTEMNTLSLFQQREEPKGEDPMAVLDREGTW